VKIPRLVPFFVSILITASETSEARGELDIVVEGLAPSSGLARQLATETRDSYLEARVWFGVELRSPVIVEWLTDVEDLRRHGVEPRSVAGLAKPSQGRILLVGPALTRPARRRGVLLHELIHLLFAEATASAEVLPPRWLDEGVAMWRSGEWDLGLEWRANHADLLADAAAAGSVVPLRELDSSFPSGPFFHVAYAQSLSFVEWLLHREGEEGLRRLLHLLGEDLDPEPAFLQVYGIPLDEAEEAWRRSLERGRLSFLPSARTIFTLLWGMLGLLLIVKFIRTRLQLRQTRDELEEWES
jgi:hypothetical protein